MTVGTADVDVAARQATISGLTPSTAYTVSVAAVNGAGTGPIRAISIETTGEIIVVLLPMRNIILSNRWTQYISWLLIHYLHHHLMVTGAESDSYWLHHLLLQH